MWLQLGLEWGEKKSICNKFPQKNAVTTLTWPHERHSEFVFGLQDGKVRLVQLNTSKTVSLYSTDSFVVSSCSKCVTPPPPPRRCVYLCYPRP